MESCSQFAQLTGYEFIHFWLQSIYTYICINDNDQCGEETEEKEYESPPIFIIGTHRGKNRQKKVQVSKRYPILCLINVYVYVFINIIFFSSV